MTVEAALSLRLLGAPRIGGANAARAGLLLQKPKAFALLVYLAMAGPGAFRRRDDLLARFWPEADTARARNALRQSLFLLRQHLPDGTLVARGQDEVALSGVVVDVSEFEARLSHGCHQEALAVYGGALLDGFRLYGESDFDAWVVLERERLERRMVNSVLAMARRPDIDVEESGRLLDFAMQQAPYDEDLLREAVGLLQARGNAVGAARRYDASAERFRIELGISLSPETEQVAPVPSVVPRVRSVPPMAELPTLSRPREVTAEARRLHLRARHLAGLRSPLTIMQAIDGYERAVALSPDYAEAHAGLAFALCQAVVYVDYPGTDAWPRAKAHALRAGRLDPRLGDALAVLAHVTLCYDYDWAGAETLYLRALELDPSSAAARQLYPLYFLTSVGRIGDALEFIDRARDDMPDNAGLSVYYAMCCVFGRRFDRALQEADFIVEHQPSLVQGQWVRGMALEGLGDHVGAVSCFERGVEMTGRSSLYLSQLGRALASAGDHDRAIAILRELEERGSDSGPALYHGAEILTALGEHDQALDRLHRAYRQRNSYMIFAGVRYALDPLRPMKRFRDLLVRMGMPADGRTANTRGDGAAPTTATAAASAPTSALEGGRDLPAGLRR